MPDGQPQPNPRVTRATTGSSSNSSGRTGSPFQRGFAALIVTQFLGAANDNVLKQVMLFMIMGSGLWAARLGDGGQGVIGLCFTLPFILLSGYAGQYADHNSKQKVTIQVKALEIGIALAAGISLWFGDGWSGWFWVALISFVALAAQSAFFGPAKYGMIPELVDSNQLSRANGVINMFTNIAAIAGTLLAGLVAERFWVLQDQARGGAAAAATTGNGTAPIDPAALPHRVDWLPLAVMLAIALLGFAASLLIPKLPAKDPQLRYNPNPFSAYYHALRDMAKGPLLSIAIAWAYFYMVAFAAMLLLPEYKDLLGITYTRASILLTVLAVSIGIGSALAGLISGKRIQPRLVPIGAVGLTVFLGLLGFVPGPLLGSTTQPQVSWIVETHVIPAGNLGVTIPIGFYSAHAGPLTLWTIAVLLSGAGMFAGAYIIPLQALIQDLSPASERGRYLGTTNALSFVFMSFGAVVIQLARGWFGLQTHHAFFVCCGLALIGTVYLFIRFRKPLYTAVEQSKSHDTRQ